MINRNTFSILLLTGIMMNCNPKTEVATQTTESENVPTKGVIVSPFGQLEDGTKVSLYTVTNSKGSVMKVMNYGGIITSLMVPDKDGKFGDIVLGYDSLAGYLKSNPFFGALIGRYGNRIAKGKFSLDGKTYTLATNNGPNHLHGGEKGFDKVFWNIEETSNSKGVGLKLTYNAKDMEEGYPGNLSVQVTYILADNNELQIDYKATTDKKTIVNLTQHTYFNLNEAKSDILSHKLTLVSDNYLPVDPTLIPTGKLQPVKGTPFDFNTPTAIGSRINSNDPQLKAGNGYDHCWVLNGKTEEGLRVAAVLYDSISGREVTVRTTEPGLQFYSGNFLDGSITGKNNIVYNFRYGLCLETQHFPDSPNRPEFPRVILEPGNTYTTRTVYSFSIK
jgi:aldose 1-epimerase